MEKNELPKGWVEVCLSDIGQIISGGTPSTKVSEYFHGNISWITPADLTGYKNKYIEFGSRNLTEEGLNNSSARLMPGGSVLFSSRAPIGYIVIAKNTMATNQGFKNIVLNKGIFNEYVYYYLKYSRNKIEKMASGTTFKEISSSKFSQVKIFLAPYNEQCRIVEAIEENLSELDKAVEYLQKVKEQLKIYRQAVLKWAFEGKLTEKWRKQAWEWTTLGNFAENIKIGPFGTLLHQSDYIDNGVPIINPKHIRQQKIVPDKKVTTSDEKAQSLYSYKLETNDILLARRGEMGRTAYVSDKENGWLCGTGSMIIRLNNIHSGKLYSLILSSGKVKKFLEDNCSGTTMSNLNEKIANKIPVPVIPPMEQEKIITEIESRLSVCDKIEETITKTLQKAEGLRYSILKKAFEGKLVSQDPRDEPAEILLARIKKENIKTVPSVVKRK